MKIPKSLRRTFWPFLATLTSLLLYNANGWILNELLPGISDPKAIRLTTGSISYFASAWFAGRLAAFLLECAAPDQRRVPKLLQELISAAFFVAALIATFMLFLGQSMSGALASSGLLLAVLGFAMRNVVADAISGIALGLEAPYRIGDWIEIEGGTKGRIVEIGWRTTRLLTGDSTYMILPNSQIARQKLTNYSAPRSNYRAQVQITLSHELSTETAKQILTQAASQAPLVILEPPPDVRVLAYERDGIKYALRYWVPSFAEEIDCRDAVLCKVNHALREQRVPPPRDHIQVFTRDEAVNFETVSKSAPQPNSIPDGIALPNLLRGAK